MTRRTLLAAVPWLSVLPAGLTSKPGPQTPAQDEAASILHAVFVHAGRRIDPPGAPEPRFPLANVDVVRRRIAELLDREKPAALVSAPACGSDLLVLEIAGKMRIQRVVLLPSPPEEFRRASVIDRPGDWGRIFDRLLKEVRVETLSVFDGQGYLETNLKLLDRAQELARRRKTSAVALVVWNGKSRGPDDVTDHFRLNAKRRGLRIVEIPTL